MTFWRSQKLSLICKYQEKLTTKEGNIHFSQFLCKDGKLILGGTFLQVTTLASLLKIEVCFPLLKANELTQMITQITLQI